MSSPLNNLLSGLHLSDQDLPAPRAHCTGSDRQNNRRIATVASEHSESYEFNDSASHIEENNHLKHQLRLRDRQIAELAARLEALERRSLSSPSPYRIKTSPVSPRALPDLGHSFKRGCRGSLARTRFR